MTSDALLLSIFLLVHEVSVLAQRRTFTCTIPSLCSDVAIDPRIQTPTQSPSTSAPPTCPTGYVPCNNVKCGISAVGISPGTQNGEATRGAFPWHTFIQNKNALGVNNGYAGGGVLIDQNFVLTAAHKIRNLTAVNVILGLHNLNEIQAAQTIGVSSIYYHSSYNSATLKEDIALLLLSTPVNLGNTISIACLPAAGRDYQGSSADNCLVTGFGQISFTSGAAPTPYLKQVHVPVISTETCRTIMNTLVTPDTYLDANKEICAGGQTNLDSCTQDGGSGLVCRDSATTPFSLVGLVNWGKGCGITGVPGVYVRVSSYIDWITRTRNCMLTSNFVNCPDASQHTLL
nr:chymotrypsinogen A-like [Leptinotarsa decemlineata]